MRLYRSYLAGNRFLRTKTHSLFCFFFQVILSQAASEVSWNPAASGFKSHRGGVGLAKGRRRQTQSEVDQDGCSFSEKKKKKLYLLYSVIAQ